MVALFSRTTFANSFSSVFILFRLRFLPIRRTIYSQNYKKMRNFLCLSCKSKNYSYLCTAEPLERVSAEAQMAESVDALVSNTSRFTPVPVRPRLWVRKEGEVFDLSFFCTFFVVCYPPPKSPACAGDLYFVTVGNGVPQCPNLC